MAQVEKQKNRLNSFLLARRGSWVFSQGLHEGESRVWTIARIGLPLFGKKNDLKWLNSIRPDLWASFVGCQGLVIQTAASKAGELGWLRWFWPWTILISFSEVAKRRWCSWWEDIGGKLRPGGSNLRHWNCAIWQDHYWNIGLYCMNLLMLHYLSLMRQGSLPSCLKVSGLHNLTLEPVQPIWTPHLNLNCWQPQGVGKSSKTSQTRWVLVWLSTWRPRNLLGTSNLDSAAEFAEEHQRLQFAVSFCFSPFQKMQVSADLAQGTVDQAAYDRRSGFWSRLQAISSWRKTSPENAG